MFADYQQPAFRDIVTRRTHPQEPIIQIRKIRFGSLKINNFTTKQASSITLDSGRVEIICKVRWKMAEIRKRAGNGRMQFMKKSANILSHGLFIACLLNSF